MDIYWKVVGLLLASLRPWSTPALQKMSLHPRDRKENPLMVGCCQVNLYSAGLNLTPVLLASILYLGKQRRRSMQLVEAL